MARAKATPNTSHAAPPEVRFYSAIDGFFVGGSVFVNAGDTVEAGHPIMRGREALFQPFRPTFALTEPASPPEPEPSEPEGE